MEIIHQRKSEINAENIADLREQLIQNQEEMKVILENIERQHEEFRQRDPNRL